MLHSTVGTVTFFFLLVFASRVLQGKELTSWIINGAFLHSPAGVNVDYHLSLR